MKEYIVEKYSPNIFKTNQRLLSQHKIYAPDSGMAIKKARELYGSEFIYKVHTL